MKLTPTKIFGALLLGFVFYLTSAQTSALSELPSFMEPGFEDEPEIIYLDGDTDQVSVNPTDPTAQVQPDPALCPNVTTYGIWRNYGTENNHYIFSGPGNTTLNNCPANAPTGTEITDDTDPTRSLLEDNYKGGNRGQLCLGASDPAITITSEWVKGSCPSGTINTGVYDSDDGNYSDVTGKRYYHKHNFNEEDNTSNDLSWCLGVESPGDNYQITSRKTRGVNTCASDETYLFYSDDTRWNMNNEDDADKTSFCVKVSPKPGAVCGTKPVVDLTVNGSNGPLAVASGSNLVLAWTTQSSATCTASSGWTGVKSANGTENQVFSGTPTTFVLTCMNAAGETSDTVTVNPSAPALATNLTINGSDGPLNVPLGTPLSLAWSSVSATSCTAWGTGWGSGQAVVTAGSASTTATASDTYILQCTNGLTTVTDSVQVILTNSLKVCQNSCSSGIQRGNASSSQSFTLARGGTQNLVSCFNPSSSCNDGSGNVTGSTSWGEGGSDVVSLSGSDPRILTGNNVGTESVSASYSGQTANMNVTVTCLPTVSCDNAPGRENYCRDDTFNVDNGCGTTISCNGTKTCNYNWKEVAP